MNIKDAKPGDVLADKDGAIWLRGVKRARVLLDAEDAHCGDKGSDYADAMDIGGAEKFGPFTIIYPQAADVERDALRADVARLQSELDAARAIIESGANR